MKRRILLLFVIPSFLLLLVFEAPYITAYRLKNAVKEVNYSNVMALTDLPALRANLKEGLKAKFMTSMPKNKTDEILGKEIGETVMLSFLDPLVDNLLQEQNIKKFMEHQKLKKEEASKTGGEKKEVEDKLDITKRYTDINTFKVTVRGENGTLGLVFKRKDVVFWKLSGIDLP